MAAGRTVEAAWSAGPGPMLSCRVGSRNVSCPPPEDAGRAEVVSTFTLKRPGWLTTISTIPEVLSVEFDGPIQTGGTLTHGCSGWPH